MPDLSQHYSIMAEARRALEFAAHQRKLCESETLAFFFPARCGLLNCHARHWIKAQVALSGLHIIPRYRNDERFCDTTLVLCDFFAVRD